MIATRSPWLTLGTLSDLKHEFCTIDRILSSVSTICTLLYHDMLRHAFRNIYLKIGMELMFMSMMIIEINPGFATTSTCGK